MRTAWDVIDGLIQAHAPEPHMRAEWRCSRDSATCSRSARDPIWKGRPFTRLTGSHTAYLELWATVDWDRGCLHLTQEDWKTGGGDRTWDIPLDTAMLEGLAQAKWPEPGVGPMF